MLRGSRILIQLCWKRCIQSNIILQDGVAELDKILKFLEVELDDKLKQDIIENCGFDKMKKEKAPIKMKTLLGEFTIKDMFNEGKEFFRKGTRGNPMKCNCISKSTKFHK